MLDSLTSTDRIRIKQRRELLELVGFETRNKYEIHSLQGLIGFAAEQRQGVLGAIFRLYLGHWRTFDIRFFDVERRPVLNAHHPFRLLFQCLEITDAQGRSLGRIEQRFGFFSKRFDVENARGVVILRMRARFWNLWTFPFFRNDQRVGAVKKRWGGLLTEAFTDKDTFEVEFADPRLSQEDRLLMLVASIFIDLQYFERKAD